MSRYVLGWVLAASLLLPLVSPAAAAADPVDPARITISTESGPGLSILWSFVARFLGPSGSVIDPNGKPEDNPTRPQPPAGAETKANAGVAIGAASGSAGNVVAGSQL